MREQFLQTNDLMNGEWTVWSSVLGPSAVNEYDTLVELAETTITRSDATSRDRYVKTKGALYFRAGRLAEAIEILRDVEQRLPDNATASTSPAYTWYFLAMAHHRLGQNDDAKAWLTKADDWTENALKEHEDGSHPLRWNRRLTLQLLQEEAQALLGRLEPDEARDSE